MGGAGIQNTLYCIEIGTNSLLNIVFVPRVLYFYLPGLTSQAGRTEGVRVELRQAEGMRRVRAEEFLRDLQHVRLIPSTLKWACW